MTDAKRTFTSTIEVRRGGGISVEIPFDPSDVWGLKERHHVRGTIDGHGWRGPIARAAGRFVITAGPAWCRDREIGTGDRVRVVLEPEGPQSAALEPDLAAALADEPEARVFFDSLPTFYRKNFMRWIDGAKRPETRARRIAETVQALKAGRRER